MPANFKLAKYKPTGTQTMATATIPKAEKERPARKYYHGDIVKAKVKDKHFEQYKVVGYNWGEQERITNRAVWVYWLKPHVEGYKDTWYPVTEDQITDKVN